MQSSKKYQFNQMRNEDFAEAHLKSIAEQYLNRFHASESMLRSVLFRRVAKQKHFCNVDDEVLCNLKDEINRICVHYRKIGVLDDELFAITKAQNWFRRGYPPLVIKNRLKQKNISDVYVEIALGTLASSMQLAETVACIRFARRKLLGPFKRNDPIPGDKKKLFSKLSRAGFSSGAITTLINTTTIEELEAIEDLIY